MTGIAQRLLRIRPVCRRYLLQFSTSADPKLPPLSTDISNFKSEAVKSVFAYLNDFVAYLKGDQKTGIQLNPVSSKGFPSQGFTKKLGEEEKTLQRHDIPGAIEGHTQNDPNEMLECDKANVEVCCKCCALLALSKAWLPPQNIDETAISIIKSLDEQSELTLEERFVLSQKLMSSPAVYAMFKAYKGEERVLFLQSLLNR